jgi:cytochrome P450
MRHTAFEIVAAAMLSDRGDFDTQRFERCIGDCSSPTRWTLASSLLTVPEWFPYPGRRKARSVMAHLRAELARTIAARRHDKTGHDDLLERLMSAVDSESRRALTDQEVIDHLFTLISAGHGATALALTWVFCLLCRHPDAEARILEEIETICGEGPVRAEHIRSLSWTRQVIQEAMRLYPPVPIVARTVGHSFRLGDFALSAGMVIHVPIYAIHRNRRLWERPDDFDPTRFSTECCEDRHRYAYMPFGAGPRVCIGATFAMMEATAVLAVVLKSVRIRMSKASLEPTPMARVTLRPAEPLWMTVSHREP